MKPVSKFDATIFVGFLPYIVIYNKVVLLIIVYAQG